MFSVKSNGGGNQARVWLLVALAVLVTAGCSSLPADVQPNDSLYALEPAEEGLLAEFSRNCEDRVPGGESCFLLLDRNEEDLRWHAHRSARDRAGAGRGCGSTRRHPPAAAGRITTKATMTAGAQATGVFLAKVCK